jgi:DNA-binding IclR family transcriptional regulator
MDENIGRVFARICESPCGSIELQRALELPKPAVTKALRALLVAGKVSKTGKTKATVYTPAGAS